tara:strand:- start:2251 stop:2571 length:321 start_codon:yes stop_codon:yes gene_type:complete
MIPFIRSHLELMAITESRDCKSNFSEKHKINSPIVHSSQNKRHVSAIKRKKVELPDLPKIFRQNWVNNKKYISKFLDELEYNDQIQSSYDLTLQERQNNIGQEEVA